MGQFCTRRGRGRGHRELVEVAGSDRFDLQFDPRAPDARGHPGMTSEFSFIRNQDRASVTPPFLFEVANPRGADGDLASATTAPSDPGLSAHRTWTEGG